jgi:hypothetical protein
MRNIVDTTKLLEPIGRQSSIELPYGIRRMGTRSHNPCATTPASQQSKIRFFYKEFRG